MKTAAAAAAAADEDDDACFLVVVFVFLQNRSLPLFFSAALSRRHFYNGLSSLPPFVVGVY